MDMSAFVAPKSDQLNADDLIAGPRTITITRVTGTGNGEQPVAVFFEGDDGKPLKPCKSMRRVMIAAWGADASQYAGRSMTLYRDPKVKFGGMEVGGIRISAMSHIEREMVMALTVTKAKREPYKVKVLAQPKREAPKPAEDDPGWPILKSDLSLAEVPKSQFWRFVGRALSNIHDNETLTSWELGMMPMLAEASDRDALKEEIQARRAALSEGAGA